MDPLSDILSLLKPRSYLASGFDIGAPLSLAFNTHEGIKCYALMSGSGWLILEDQFEPVPLSAGDCFLLAHGKPFRLATDPSVAPVDALTTIQSARRGGGIDTTKGGILCLNGGGDCFMVGGFFALEREHAQLLLGMLPPLVVLRSENDKAAMRWALERLRQELLDPQPGSSLLAEHLAHMMLLQALRLHLAQSPGTAPGWLSALSDKQMRTAINAIHEEPGRRWTLQELGATAGMSRSIFAEKFKAIVGTSPMEYLTRWRMLLAGDRLTRTREALSEIALSLGYDSESAFSTAFKRVMGCSPRQYGRARTPASVAS